MRFILVAVLVASAPVRADVAVGAAVGAGGQGDAGYGALELRLDGEWHRIRVGLGGRAVWEGGAFRTHEWSRIVDAISIVRQLEAHAGPVALAAGALAPPTIGHVADGYRAALDDHARTGARIAIVTRGIDRAGRPHADIDLEALAEIDDVIDPALIGGAIAWQVAPPWGVRAAVAIDPITSRGAVELGGARRWEREGRRVEVGASVVGEQWTSSLGEPTMVDVPHEGFGAVGFASAAIDRGRARWTITADLRAGNGTNGAAFGPLYRVERANRATEVTSIEHARLGGAPTIGEPTGGDRATVRDATTGGHPTISDPAGGDTMTGGDPSTSDPSTGDAGTMGRAILDDVRAGMGGGLQLGVASEGGWASIGGRVRPGLGPIGTVSAGAPMSRSVQAGGWLAASPRATAGAAELRVAWAAHFYSSFQLARMYTRTDETSPLTPAWSATVWFGATTR